jgi:hypothetical protein
MSQPKRRRCWLVDVEGDTAVGGSFRGRFTSGWEGAGRDDVCDAPTRLVVTTFDGSDESVMEATLTPTYVRMVNG